MRLAEDIFARPLHLILPIHFLKLEAAQIGRMTELPSFVSWEQQGVYHQQVNNTKFVKETGTVADPSPSRWPNCR